jgi:hypothetical protein
MKSLTTSGHLSSTAEWLLSENIGSYNLCIREATLAILSSLRPYMLLFNGNERY